MSGINSEEWWMENIESSDAALNSVDVTFTKNVGEASIKRLQSRFNIHFKTAKIAVAVYSTIFEEIHNLLKERQKSKSSYSINIANMLEIGFTSGFEDEDTDAEKIGNYMIYMKNLDSSSISWDRDPNEKNCAVLCTSWVASNINSCTEDIKIIVSRAFEALHKISIWAPSPDTIIPMFCTIHSTVIEMIKMEYANAKQEDKDDFIRCFAGLYDITVMETEEGLLIQLKPGVFDKGRYKNDRLSSNYE